MRLSFEEIRRAVLEVVQPIAKGTFDAIDDAKLRARLKNVIPFGTADHYETASPYGLISSPIKGVRAYFLNLMGSALAPIIIAHIDGKRPQPVPGETILYCLSADGGTVPVKISLKPDGTLRIDATTKVELVCEDVEIGKEALEKVIKGETFLTLFNQHQHLGNLGAPTGPPIVPMVEAQHLSSEVKTGGG
jgi:hypothetical protein